MITLPFAFLGTALKNAESECPSEEHNLISIDIKDLSMNYEQFVNYKNFYSNFIKVSLMKRACLIKEIPIHCNTFYQGFSFTVLKRKFKTKNIVTCSKYFRFKL